MCADRDGLVVGEYPGGQVGEAFGAGAVQAMGAVDQQGVGAAAGGHGGDDEGLGEVGRHRVTGVEAGTWSQ